MSSKRIVSRVFVLVALAVALVSPPRLSAAPSPYEVLQSASKALAEVVKRASPAGQEAEPNA